MSAISHFAYVWTYEIDAARETEFLSAYQSDGEWARFFSRDGNYLRTELLCDSGDRHRYMTIDYWTSKSARDSFREANAQEFQKLDGKCEAYTVSEKFIGDFVVLVQASSP